MRNKSHSLDRPPRLARWVLTKTINSDIRYSAIGDFDEIYTSIATQDGIKRAMHWYWKQVARSIPSFITDSLYWRFHMFQNYLKVAFRKMMRQKIFSLINIAGLAIGMAICILIFLWVQDELNYDRFHENTNNIYRIVMNDQNYEVKWPVVSIPVGPALKQDFPEILDSARVSDFRGLITHEDKKSDEIGAYVDPSFLDIFSFPYEKGNPETALNTPSAIVISQKMAEKFFGHENYTAENVKCDGCLSDGVVADKECKARPCAIERGVENCAYCDDFHCDKMRHLIGSREGMLVFCYPRTSSITEEEYNLCMRQFDSMPNLLGMLAEAGKMPPWVGNIGEVD